MIMAWKKFSIFVLALLILSSGFVGPAGANTPAPGSGDMAYVSIAHYYDGLMDTDSDGLNAFISRDIYPGEQPLPDWSWTKKGTYEVTGMEIKDLTLNVVTNHWLYNASASKYDLYSSESATEWYAEDAYESWNNNIYGSALYDSNYEGCAINGTPVNGDSYFSIQDFKNVTFNFYYGGTQNSGYVESDFESDFESIAIGDLYTFEEGHRYQLSIEYEFIDNPGPYAYLHVIHNYDGIIVTDMNRLQDCDEINDDRIPAGIYNVSRRIAPEYSGHEYIVDSVSLHYETAVSDVSYSGQGAVSGNSYHNETMIIGDLFNAFNHSSVVYYNGSGTPNESETVAAHFSPDVLGESQYSPIETKIGRYNNLWYNFVTAAVSPFVESPITYFRDQPVEIENDLALTDSEYDFEEGLHYVLVVNYKYGFPITHHYSGGSGEEILTEGKVAAYGTPTELYNWKKDKQDYELVRIEVIESKNWLNVRDYSSGCSTDHWMTGGNILLSSKNYTVLEGSSYPVYTFINYDAWYSYNQNESDEPWEDDMIYGDSLNTLVMKSGRNVLNLFYNNNPVPTSILTLVSGDANIRTIWDDKAPFETSHPNGDRLNNAKYIFTEGKMYEVHYYYVKGTPQTYTLTYDSNGADNPEKTPVDTTAYPAGSYATVRFPGDLTKTGSEFICWNDKEDGSGESYYPGVGFADKVLMDSDKTVYAVWGKPLAVPLKHDYRYYESYYGTEWNATETEIKTVTTNAPVSLEEWYICEYNTTYFGIEKVVIQERQGSSVSETVIGYDEANNPPVLFTFENDREYSVIIYYTYFAYSSPYNVTYFPNTANTGDVPVDSSNPYLYNSLVTVLDNLGAAGDGENVLRKTGHTFAGWNTKANGTGYSYSAGDTFRIRDEVINDAWSGVDLYAQWAPSGFYTVTYESGAAGSSATDMPVPSTIIAEGGEPFNIAGLSPAWSGYSFEGWLNSEDGNVYRAGEQFTMPDENVVLTAQWKQGGEYVYSVTYDPGIAGVFASDMPNPLTVIVAADDTFDISSTAPSWLGCTFDGWLSSRDGEVYSAGGNFTMPADNVVLTAQWIMDGAKYTVVYHSNGASGNVPVDEAEYSSGDPVTVKPKGNLQMTGYTFKGWNTAMDITGTTYQPGNSFNIFNDTDLYAQWEKENGTNPPGPKPKPQPEPPEDSANPPAYEDDVPTDSSEAGPGYGNIVFPIMIVLLIAALAFLYVRWQRRKTQIKNGKV